MKGLSYVQPRGTTARGGLVFRHVDDHDPGGEASGPSDQAVPGTLAGKGSQVCRPYGETHHPTGDEDQGDRTDAGRHARKRAAPQGRGAGTGERGDAGGDGDSQKKTRAPTYGACRTGRGRFRSTVRARRVRSAR